MKNIVKLIVASGESSSDMRYASGLSTPDEFIWFQSGREKTILMSPLEYSRALAQAGNGVEVCPEHAYGGNRIEMLAEVLRRHDASGFIVPENFPFGLAEKIRRAGMVVQPVDGVFFPGREYKSAAEVEKITAALRGAEAGFARAVEILRECDIDRARALIWNGAPLTSELLRSEIDIAMLRLGLLPTGTICAGAAQSAQPHNQGSGALLADTPIVMDIFPRSAVTGYWGDFTRTVVRGRAADVVKRAYDAVLAARELGKSHIAVGANPAEIHRAAADLMASRGFATGRNADGDYGFFHGLGHGVGLDIHEAPRLSPRNTEPLKGGEVITVEPGLYYPEWGGIRLEDLVWLPPSGPVKVLTSAPDFLTVE